MNFKQLGLIEPIVKALAEQGYETPSPIQAQAIPPGLSGRDVLGCAQTGTGKTCAFATPILQRLSASSDPGRPVRALVLTPTRELAIQIGESFQAYGKYLPLRSAVIFGGVGQNPQAEQLKKGVDILVATPGRLLDLHGQGLVRLGQVETFVLDEADRMLDMGFIHDVRRVLKALPQKKQTLFFSATMPPEVMELVNALLHRPAKVAVDPVSSPVDVIEQSAFLVDRGNKTKLLARLVGGGRVKNALVFTRTKHGANKVAADLGKAGISAAAIHGNKSQTARQQALADFKAGHIKVLVATDIAARGLDIEELSHVFNYHLPEVPETYVHRIGRTGRAGHGGTAVSFCDFGEQPYLKDIEKLLGRPIPVRRDNPWPMAVFEAPAKDAKGRVQNPEDAEARAAARARKREREAAAGKDPAGGGGPPRTEKRAKAARPAAPESAPAAPAEKPVKKRGIRHNRLEETAPRPYGDEAPVRVDFQRPDPLAGDVIMDATARLLARRLPAKNPAAGPARPGKEQEKRARREGKRAKGEPERGGEAPGGGKRPAQGQRPAPQAKERARRGRPPYAPEPYNRGGQKDSTEQPSLMKPYYLNQDD